MRPALLAAVPALALALCCAPARAGQVFTFKDWAVACDNTRHCAAVGYQSADAEDPVALWIGRAAGPDAPLEVRLSADATGERAGGPTALVGAPGVVLQAAGDRLDAMGFAQVLPRLLEADHAEVLEGDVRLRLSLAGLKAALLKMDELQGRAGTPGALVDKGRASEAGVPGPLPAPRVRAAAAVAAKPGDAALLKTLVERLKPSCEVGDEAPASLGDTTLHRVSATKVVLLHVCPGDYNRVTLSWLAADRPPYAMKPVDFHRPAGAPPADDSANAGFSGGRLHTLQKGRGVADCGLAATWDWTGRGFELAEVVEAPLCRGMPMGGFALVTWTSAP